MNTELSNILRSIQSDQDYSVLDKQEFLWETLGGVSVEDLITMQIVERSDKESILDLILNEIRLREPHNAFSMSFIEREYLQRFSELENPLKQHFDFEKLACQFGVSETIANPQCDTATPTLVIPGFQILSEHARGGGGVVYRAIQTNLNREVAIKVFRFESQSSIHAFQTLKEEAFKTSKLFHKNIVQVFEFGEHEDGFYMALPFIHGGSLTENQASLGGRYAEISSIMRDVSSAVQYAHELGVLHCDITPNNILLSAENLPLLTDFGLSKDSEDLERLRIIDEFLKGNASLDEQSTTEFATQRALGGTKGFMSPEQFKGDSESLCEKTDIYGLGAVLFFLLTGKSISNPLTISNEELRKTFPRDCPKDLQEICMKCIALHSKDRYETALHLSDDLLRFQKGQIVQARPLRGAKNLPARVLRWSKRSPLLASLALFTLISTCLFVTALLKSNQVLTKRSTDLSSALKFSALTNFELGKLAAASGPVSQSVDAYRMAIAIQEKYLKLNPMDADATLLLAKAKSNLGLSLSKRNEIPTAISTLKEAISDLENHPDGAKQIDEWDTELANFHVNLGNQFLKLPDLANVRTHYEKAETIRQNHAYSSSDEKKLDLAKSYFDLGNLCRLEPDGLQNAILKYRNAISIFEEIYTNNKEIPGTIDRLTQCYINLCICSKQAGKLNEVDQILQGAITKWEAVLRNDPKNNDKLKTLAILQHNLGHHFSIINDPVQSYKYLQEAKGNFVSIINVEGDGTATRLHLGNCLTTLSRSCCAIALSAESADQKDRFMEESLVNIDQAIDLLESQIQRSMPSGEWLDAYLGALDAKAICLSHMNRFNESIAILQNILDAGSKISPKTLQLKTQRINTFNALGRTMMDSPESDLEDAVLVFRAGIAECEDLLESQKDQTASLNLMFSLCNAVGRTYSKIGESIKSDREKASYYEKSLLELNKSVDLGELLLAQGKLQAGNNITYVENHLLRANAYSYLEDFELAVADLKHVMKMMGQENPLLPLTRVLYGIILAKMSRIQDAYQEIEAVASLSLKDSHPQFLAACCMAQIYEKIESSSEQDLEYWNDRSHILFKALEYLKAAEEAGYFKSPENFDLLLKEEDLNSIRSTVEFSSFLHSIQSLK